MHSCTETQVGPHNKHIQNILWDVTHFLQNMSCIQWTAHSLEGLSGRGGYAVPALGLPPVVVVDCDSAQASAKFSFPITGSLRTELREQVRRCHTSISQSRDTDVKISTFHVGGRISLHHTIPLDRYLLFCNFPATHPY